MKKTKSAGGVVVNPKGEIAIVNQKHLSWSLPKGHVEENEEILSAAKREVYEETGITELTLLRELESYSRYAMNHENNDDAKELKALHFYLFSTTQMELTPTDKDNPEAIWVAKEDVENYLTHPEDKKFFRESVLPLLSEILIEKTNEPA